MLEVNAFNAFHVDATQFGRGTFFWILFQIILSKAKGKNDAVNAVSRCAYNLATT